MAPNNPIIHRELITLLRQPKALLIQLAYVGAIIGLVLAVWPDSATVNLGGRQATQLFSVFVYGLLVALALIGPAFPAMAIVRERQQGTLRLLLTSPLTPLDILIGKVSGAIGFIALLLALSLPAAAACFAMGGIDLRQQFLPAYGILALTAVHYAMVALYVSSTAKSTDGALRFTYGYILLTAVIVLGPFYLVQGQSTIPQVLTDAAEWLAAVSPAPAVMQVIGHEEVGARGIKVQADHVMRYTIWASAISVLCAFALLRQLQPHMMDRPRSKGFVTDEASKGVQIFRRFMYLGFFDPKKRTGSIADYENPVMMKEFRTRTFGRAHWMARIVGGCAVVSLLISFLAVVASMTVGIDYIAGVLVIFQIGLIILVTPALAAALISAEVESGGWTLLKMTPLSARRIVFGKLLSVGWTLAMILIATLPGYAIIWKIDPNQSERIIDGLVSLGLTATFALMLGAACSAVIPKTAAATTAAYMILVGLTVVTLLPWLGEGTLFGRDAVELSLAFNPLAASLNAVKMRAFAEYDLIPRTWYFMIGGTVACGIVLWFKTWRLTKPQ